MVVCELYWLLCALHQRKTDSQCDGYVRLNMFCQGKLSSYGANPQQKQFQKRIYLYLGQTLSFKDPQYCLMGTMARKKTTFEKEETSDQTQDLGEGPSPLIGWVKREH